MLNLDYQMMCCDDEHARVAYYLQLFSQVRIRRVNFEPQWEESAALAWPEYMNTFAWGHVNSPGVKKTQFQVDSAAAIASWRFMSIVDSITTPHTMMWSKVTASNADLLKDRTARIYFNKVTEILWAERYKPEANFLGQNQTNLQAYGVFGNMGMFVDELRNHPKKLRGLSYKSTSPGEIYVLQNMQGIVDGYVRAFKLDARQAHQRWADKIPPAVTAALQIQSKQLFNFIEFVHPRADWMPWETLTPKGKPWVSCYISVEGMNIVEEGGYRAFPEPYGRYMQAPEEDYGRGPAQMVLPALKTSNAIAKDLLEQGHLALKPAYLIGDDGLMDFKSHAGAYNYGGVTADGKPLVHMLPTGQIQAGEELLQRQDRYIGAAFLTDLYDRLWNDAKRGGGDKSAREVIEDANDRGLFLAPTLGRLSTEYLGPLITRELDLLSWLGKLPPMPPSVREAKGDFKIVYTSPIAQSVHLQEVAGAMQTVEFARDIVNVTGDPSLLDTFDFDTMLQEVGDIRNVPDRWFADQETKAAKAKARQAAQQREQDAKELPGKAAMAKAQAIVSKAQTGGNIGGALSGTPAGGMPQMPGQPGIPGQPSQQVGQPGTPGQPGEPGGY